MSKRAREEDEEDEEDRRAVINKQNELRRMLENAAQEAEGFEADVEELAGAREAAVARLNSSVDDIRVPEDLSPAVRKGYEKRVARSDASIAAGEATAMRRELMQVFKNRQETAAMGLRAANSLIDVLQTELDELEKADGSPQSFTRPFQKRIARLDELAGEAWRELRNARANYTPSGTFVAKPWEDVDKDFIDVARQRWAVASALRKETVDAAVASRAIASMSNRLDDDALSSIRALVGLPERTMPQTGGAGAGASAASSSSSGGWVARRR